MNGKSYIMQTKKHKDGVAIRVEQIKVHGIELKECLEVNL